MTSESEPFALQLQTHTLPVTQIAVDTTPESVTQNGPFAVLRVPSFAWFLTGTTLSNAAQWIQNVTLSWLVYDLTSSGTMLGTLNLVRSAATLGLATFAGVAIDRLPRRRLLYATSLWMFVVCCSFGLVQMGSPAVVWPLFLFSFLGGIGQAVNVPLRDTVVFSIVPRSHAPSAVALMQTGWAVMRSVGPAIGGFLLLWFGPAGNFFAQAAAYALVTLTILNLKLPRQKQDVAKVKNRGSFVEGWKYIMTQPTTLVFLLMSWVLPLFIIPNFSALPPIYAKDVFNGNSGTLGTLMSAMGVGGIVGGFVTTWLSKLERRGLLQLAALLLLGLSFTAFALTSSLWVAVFFIALAGFFEMIYLTTNQTLLQLSIPDGLRGRVMSIVSLKAGLSPVGAFVAGIGADLVGPRTMTLIFSGIIVAIAVIVYLTVPIVREHRMSHAMANSEAL